MSRLSRYTQQLFGTSAATNQMAKFGSLAASAPATYSGATITPTIVQTLSAYASGWFSAVIGGNSPCIEDMNALCFLFAYQLSYIMQLGMPEWDSGTTYYKGSIVQDGSGNVYISLIDTNLNNALSSGTSWRALARPQNIVAINPATQSPYTLTAGDNGKTFLVNSLNGAMTFNLLSPTLNFTFSVKDIGGNAQANGITYHRFSTEEFEGIASDYTLNANFGEQEIGSDATNWWITGR